MSNQKAKMSRSKEEAIAAGIKVSDTRHSMNRRKSWHDYRRQGTYMLTFVVEGRQPLLGKLLPAGHPPESGGNRTSCLLRRGLCLTAKAMAGLWRGWRRARECCDSHTGEVRHARSDGPRLPHHMGQGERLSAVVQAFRRVFRCLLSRPSLAGLSLGVSHGKAHHLAGAMSEAQQAGRSDC